MNGKYNRNSEAEKHLCKVRCLVRFQGENEGLSGKSRVRIVRIREQVGTKSGFRKSKSGVIEQSV